VHGYVKMMHESSARKASAISKWKRVASFRFGTNKFINGSMIDLLINIENKMDTVMVVSTKGKSTLPSYSMMRGFDLDKLRDNITSDSRRCIVTAEIRLEGGENV